MTDRRKDLIFVWRMVALAVAGAAYVGATAVLCFQPHFNAEDEAQNAAMMKIDAGAKKALATVKYERRPLWLLGKKINGTETVEVVLLQRSNDHFIADIKSTTCEEGSSPTAHRPLRADVSLCDAGLKRKTAIILPVHASGP
ncbi:MAG: hypothetical protein HGA90_07260 [Alphaproteobacteria bacterium]|nr:hypothetical protein [Alphaproteobacteria bacterium]